jgi:hypothetical protein
MGYALEPHDVIVRLHPAVEGWAAGPAVTGTMRVLRKLLPNSTRLARIEALLRSAREARRFSGRSGPVRPALGAQHE